MPFGGPVRGALPPLSHDLSGLQSRAAQHHLCGGCAEFYPSGSCSQAVHAGLCGGTAPGQPTQQDQYGDAVPGRFRRRGVFVPPGSLRSLRLLGELSWCEKMLSRTMRGDAEGYYRWHWLLVDSLEIYFDVKGLHYYGPKKALRLLEQTDQEAFRIYTKALQEFKHERLSDWIFHLKSISTFT